MKGSETEQTLREINMIGTERLLSDLQRALGQRQRVVILSGAFEPPELRNKFVSLMQQTIMLGRHADFREPNLITLRSAFEFCRDIQTIWAVCFRHQLRALFFL